MIPNSAIMVPNGGTSGGGGGGIVSIPPMIDAGIVYVPGLANGFSYTIPNGVWHVVFNGTNSLSIGTITMPSAPTDGMVIRLKTMQWITGLTILPNVGQTVNDYPPNMAQFSYFEATYDASNTTWYLEFIEQLLAQSNITYYVNPNTTANPGWGTGNDNNNGLSITTPFLTIQHAYNTALLYNWQNGFQPIVKLADGNYVGSNGTQLNILEPLIATQGMTISGYNSNPATVNIGGQFFVGAGNLFISNIGFNLPLFTGLNPGSAINPAGGTVTISTAINFTTTTGRDYSPFFFDPAGGTIFINNATLNFTGTFWDGFVVVEGPGTGFFTMDGCTVNLNVGGTYNISDPLHTSQFAFVNCDHGDITIQGNTINNFANVVGQNVACTNTILKTNNSELSDIPGTSITPYWDSSDVIGGSFPKAGRGIVFAIGTPIANTTIPQYNYDVLQDSTNNCYFGLKDPQGNTHFKQIGRVPNTQTANYTFALTDSDGRVEYNAAGAGTFTVPANATVAFSIGTEIKITVIGAGSLAVAAAVGVTGDNFGTLVQWQTAVLYKRGINEWVMTGA